MKANRTKRSDCRTALRLVYVVTHPMTAYHLMNGQLAYMQSKGFDVVLITSPGEELEMVRTRERVATFAVPMEREIHLYKDFVTLVRLYLLLRKLQPDIVNASTPKAGFLGMLAAWMAGVPLRIYTLRGLRLETKKGFQRFVLKGTERMASAIAKRVICVSESLRTRYLELALVKEAKTTVLSSGSSNGVDASRFSAEDSRSAEIREKLGIPAKSPVIGFSGRLTKDKGVHELLETFEILLESFPNLYLIVMGDFEEPDPVKASYIKKLMGHPQIIKERFVKDSAFLYKAIDVLVFASHREGFPNAPLEAAASEVPAVGFNVTGTIDAIQNGITGTLVFPGDIKAMADAIATYLKDPDLRMEHGKNGREWILQKFRQEQVWAALYDEYIQLVQSDESLASEDSQYVHS